MFRGTEHLKHLKLIAVAFTLSELTAPQNLMAVLSQCRIISQRWETSRYNLGGSPNVFYCEHLITIVS